MVGILKTNLNKVPADAHYAGRGEGSEVRVHKEKVFAPK